jgi:ATP-binding cassette, subfamily B, bacterial
MARIWPGTRRRDGEPEAPADELAAELSAAYWEAYAERMASVGFLAMARRFPSLIGQAMRLGWQASRRDTLATISLNLASGVFTGYALL